MFLSICRSQLVKKQTILPQLRIEKLEKRVATIYKPAKTAMQSGMEGTRFWKIKFDTTEKFENPLIGWTSSNDPVQAVRLKFDSSDSAIEFCRKNEWHYEVVQPKQRTWKMKTYAENFKYSTGPLRQIKTK